MSAARQDHRVHLEAFDPATVRRVMPAVCALADHYYRATVSGIEHLSSAACLMVSTHNGIWSFPDTYALAAAFWRRFGPDMPAHGLAHQFVLSLPVIGPFVKRLGAVPASPSMAQAALDAGRPLLVFPGGDEDAMKPFRQRHRIHFGRRRGFVKLALRTGVPIVPVVSVGAHETMVVLHDGQALARWTGLHRLLRVKSLPLTLSFPFGLTLAGVPAVPLPSKVDVRVLPPIRLGLPSSAADDPRAVEESFRHVRDTMQAALDGMAANRRRFLLG